MINVKKARPPSGNLTLIVHYKNKPLDYPRCLTRFSGHVFPTLATLSLSTL